MKKLWAQILAGNPIPHPVGSPLDLFRNYGKGSPEKLGKQVLSDDTFKNELKAIGPADAQPFNLKDVYKRR
jgi:hypothetical protein